MAVYDQVKKLFQDVKAPEIRALQGHMKALQVDVRRLDEKIDAVHRTLNDKLTQGSRRWITRSKAGSRRWTRRSMGCGARWKAFGARWPRSSLADPR